MPARTQLDIPITIPSGNARKLIVLWGTDMAPGTVTAIFNPASENLPLVALGSLSAQSGTLHCRAWYFDSPPTGSKTIRITTTNAVRSAVSLKVLQNARVGGPPSGITVSGEAVSQLSQTLNVPDALCETSDLVLATSLGEGQLTPFANQTAGADDVVGGSFLATSSQRTHSNNGAVAHGWTAAAPADMLMVVVSVAFSF